MRKIYSFAIFSLALVTTTFAQVSNDTLVLVQGKMLKAQDSTPVAGNILYEKLPYYDDMGMASTKPDGSYEIQLIKGKTYNFSVTKSGFKKFQQEIKVLDNQINNLYIEEDIVELRKLENLIFARGSDQISPSSFSELNELAIWMNENPSIVIQLEGHTDFAGNPDANMRLSEARVLAVQEYLIDQKVKKSRIFTKAFGGTQPVTQDRSDEAKALNRRVEVRVIRR
ncbi:OmpA family protein [Ekhidna lutea]|uniref:OmpA family protein n=1 Tax=Ekhidna lutea TaxID=447679 RepID=A0A239EUA6_EKHLU|nr:OmpA family protein [Ekhidna lutea]SNS48350.1 OmpA family protein [Ekhidna lutea]